MVVMFLWCVQEVAGLKEEDLSSEEDLPSEDIDLPTVAIAPVPSVSHSTHMYRLTECSM